MTGTSTVAVTVTGEGQRAREVLGVGNASLGPVADDERARAGRIAQAFKHPLGAGRELSSATLPQRVPLKWTSLI